MRAGLRRRGAPRALEAVEELEAHKGKNGRPVPDELVGVDRARIRRDISYPAPPFLGPRLVEGIALQTILPYINETTLFQWLWPEQSTSAIVCHHPDAKYFTI